MATRLRTYVLVFLAGVVVALGVGVAAGTFLGGGPAESEPGAVDAYRSSSVLVNVSDPSGEVSVDAGTSDRVVVIDVGHRNGIDDATVQPLIEALVSNGHRVRFYDPVTPTGRALNDTLRDAHAFVSIAPSSGFTQGEIRGIAAFEASGGRVLLVQGPQAASTAAGLFGGNFVDPMAPLGGELGVGFGPGYLFNMADNDHNYRSIFATPTGDGPLTEGVDRVTFTGARPVLAGDGAGALVGTDGTVLSTTREAGSHAVVAREDGVVAIGDASFMGAGSVREADNEVLLGNVVEFLVTGAEDPDEPGPGR